MKVAVLAGGRSSEHDVSLASGAAIRDGLRAAGHETIAVTIDRDGTWLHADAPEADCGDTGGGGGEWPSGRAEPLELCPGDGLLGADVVFPALHGPYGEDGTVQGLLETLDVAYVGAGVTASAVCLDKVLFKRVLSAAATPLPQVRYMGVPEWRWAQRPGEVVQEIADELGLPVFVKPAHLGSSVGIARVSERDALAAALAQALAYDELAIVEAAAAGVEVECGVLGLARSQRDAAETGGGSGGKAAATATAAEIGSALEIGSGSVGRKPGDAGASAVTGARALASEPGEIVVSDGREWYDYEAKYTPGGMELIVPARISAAARERVRELALLTFTEVGCEGLARVDFFVDGDAVRINELNTMPGFTQTSVYAKLMAASGVPYPKLLDRLCRLGIERHERRHGRG